MVLCKTAQNKTQQVFFFQNVGGSNAYFTIPCRLSPFVHIEMGSNGVKDGTMLLLVLAFAFSCPQFIDFLVQF